jgi:hypothetical protein
MDNRAQVRDCPASVAGVSVEYRPKLEGDSLAAEPGPPSESGLHLLASWAATELEPSPVPEA